MGGEREVIYLSLHCHHRIDSCIKMGIDESHFNVSLIVRDKLQDGVHKPQPFGSERRAESESNRGPSAYQPNALPLSQTGSPPLVVCDLQVILLANTQTGRSRGPVERSFKKYGYTWHYPQTIGDLRVMGSGIAQRSECRTRD